MKMVVRIQYLIYLLKNQNIDLSSNHILCKSSFTLMHDYVWYNGMGLYKFKSNCIYYFSRTLLLKVSITSSNFSFKSLTSAIRFLLLIIEMHVLIIRLLTMMLLFIASFVAIQDPMPQDLPYLGCDRLLILFCQKIILKGNLSSKKIIYKQV